MYIFRGEYSTSAVSQEEIGERNRKMEDYLRERDETERLNALNRRVVNVGLISGPYSYIRECVTGGLLFTLSESNPIGTDEMGVNIYALSSVSNIPNSAFSNPTCSFLLPPLPMKVAKAMEVSSRPVLLKKNILLRNQKHTEIKTAGANKKILHYALYSTSIVIYDRPGKSPTYRVVLYGEEMIYWVTLDLMTSSSKYFEIVDWRMVDYDVLTDKTAEAIKNGGFVKYLRLFR